MTHMHKTTEKILTSLLSPELLWKKNTRMWGDTGTDLPKLTCVHLLLTSYNTTDSPVSSASQSNQVSHRLGIPVLMHKLHLISLFKASSCWVGSMRATHGVQLVGKATAVWCRLLWVLVVSFHFVLTQRQQIWKPMSWFFFCLSLTFPLLSIQKNLTVSLSEHLVLPFCLWGYSIPWSTSSKKCMTFTKYW